MADPDLDVGDKRMGGGGVGGKGDFVFLTLPAFLLCGISFFFFFFTQNRGGGGGSPTLDRPLPSSITF